MVNITVIKILNKIKYIVMNDNIKIEEDTFKIEIMNWDVKICKVPDVN
tara:strand:+ start:420 stop:563 length:144 start_codon:yes stop_codon:yes gene_type:complete